MCSKSTLLCIERCLPDFTGATKWRLVQETSHVIGKKVGHFCEFTYEYDEVRTNKQTIEESYDHQHLLMVAAKLGKPNYDVVCDYLTEVNEP